MGHWSWRVLVCGVLLSSSASAQTNEQPEEAGIEETEREARMHFELARRYYDTGRFSDAAQSFQRAYDLTRLPQLLYNAYLAHREAGDLEAAERSLASYVPLVEGDQRRAVEARLASLRTLRAQLAANPASEAAERPEADNAQTDRNAQTDANAPTDANARGEPTASEEEEDEATPAASPAPWIVVGGGAALLVGAAVAGGFAWRSERELDDLCDASGCDEGYESTQLRGRRLARATDALWIGGAAIAAAGLVWGILSRRRADRPPAAQVSFGCDGEGCGVTAQGRF